MIFKDQLGRNIHLKKAPTRIVSLVPSQTELLVALGLTDNIVGVTKFCVHPDSIRKEKNVVGGTKNIHMDKIRELNPDIILCNKEENTKEIVTTLEKEFEVHVSDIYTVEESLDLISQYGVIFKKQQQATLLVSEIKYQLKSFLEYKKNTPKRKVAYFIWRNPWMVAGDKTFVNHLLEINGFVNVFANQERYPEISEEELLNLRDVDLMLLSSEPFPFSKKHQNELQKLIPHVQVLLVDGEYFSWYGSRLKDAFSYFKNLQEGLS